MIIKPVRSLFLLFFVTIFIVTGCSRSYVNSPIETFGISSENATHLEHIATYGEGQALEIGLSPDDRWMAVRSTVGVRLFDTQTWDPLELDHSYQYVSQMTFSPDGNLLAIRIPAVNEIEIWHVTEARLIQRIVIPGKPSTPVGLSFTPQGDRLVGSSFREIDIWRVNDGKLIQSFEAPKEGRFKSTTISDDGTFLAAVLAGNRGSGITAWYLDDQGSFTEYRVGDGIMFDAGQFSPTGQYGALISEEQKLILWQSLRDPQMLELNNSGYISNFAWMPNANGYMLVTGGSNGDVMFWDSTTGELLTTLPASDGGAAKLLQTDAEGNWLVVVDENGSMGVWSLADEKLAWVVKSAGGDEPIQITISADGARVYGLFSSGRVRVWDMQDGQEIQMLENFTTGKVLDLTFSPDNNWIVASLENEMVKFWQQGGGEDTSILLDQRARADSVVFAGDQTRLAVGVGGFISKERYDDTVEVWDWKNAEVLQQFAGEQEEVPGCSVFRNRVAFSSDGSLLASISHDFTVNVWDTEGQKLWKTLRGHTQPILDMTISADGTMLASASLDGTIRLWRLSDGKEQQVIQGEPLGMLTVAFSPDGQLVAGSSVYSVVSLWDTHGRLVRTMDGKMKDSAMLTFSPDGSLIAAGSNEGLLLWSSQTGKLITTLPSEGGNIISVVFSDDGTLLAYGSDAGLVHLWKMP
jgi:WD40 repeat protein